MQEIKTGFKYDGSAAKRGIRSAKAPFVRIRAQPSLTDIIRAAAQSRVIAYAKSVRARKNSA